MSWWKGYSHIAFGGFNVDLVAIEAAIEKDEKKSISKYAFVTYG